ncbi:tyrosine-protein kinase abl-1 isoform X2 [Cephus cinctus]|nr:tyrosine-protein kinase abl-1 isoform X2 [Cephus cinctus]
MATSPGRSTERNRGLGLRKMKPGYFIFPWKHGSREKTLSVESSNESKTDACDSDCTSTNEMPIGVFQTIKKHICLKNLMSCKLKQKVKAVETFSTSDEIDEDVTPISDKPDKKVGDNEQKPAVNCDTKEESSDYEGDRAWNDCCVPGTIDTAESYSDIANKNSQELLLSSITIPDLYSNNEKQVCEYTSTRITGAEALNSEAYFNNTDKTECDLVDVQSRSMNDDELITSPNVNTPSTSDNEAKVSLTKELLKLSKYGWYWGPISGDEANAKLEAEPDGAFLVRDSSDDRYLLTVSFKTAGKLFHARIEHSNGMFSLCTDTKPGRFSSVSALINYSMMMSHSAVFCYSRPRYPGYPLFPVRLIKP